MWLDHVVAPRAAPTNVNYFSVIRAIAWTRAVVDHRERAVPVACWPSTIYGCSYDRLDYKSENATSENAGASITA